MCTICLFSCFLLLCFSFSCSCEKMNSSLLQRNFLLSEKYGHEANEALQRCQRYVKGWVLYADPVSGLIPRNLTKDRDIWNAKDAAADNYPFMVLTSALTDRKMFEGQMLSMLESEKLRTSRVGRIPDTYSFSRKGFAEKKIDMDRLIFGGSEYVKDGLLALTEWLGPSPWSERMTGIVDDIWQYAAYPTAGGNVPSLSNEVNGEMLQVLSRLYWMTGQKKYLQWAYCLSDYYLIEQPLVEKNEKIRLRDHGCEIIAGLSEIYLITHFKDPAKKEAYRKAIHSLFGRILQHGRNEYGMLYNWFNPLSGEHDDGICDTWGYNYNAFYTLYLVDGNNTYREAVIKVLSGLNEHYSGYQWEGHSADGYADAIEGAINLYNRENIPSVAEWIDSQIKLMWSIQKPDGVIEGWHGDGNFARTSIMYALWKSKGLSLDPWRKDVNIGAIDFDGMLYITIKAEQSWQGKVMFDRTRHLDYFQLPLDYPRINQFPEWFTVKSKKKYVIEFIDQSESQVVPGQSLLEGLSIKIEGPGKRQFMLKIE